MALTPSAMVPLGTPAPDFQLPDVTSGATLSLASFAERKVLLVMFLCRHCPYVVHVQEELARLGREYATRGVGLVAISANDAAHYPDDAPEGLRRQAREQGFVFPYLYDESQAVAKSFAAACTPDFFVYDGDRRLVYRGQLDDSRPGNGKPVTGRDLRAALDAALDGRPAPEPQRPSAGCNIKWKSSGR
ncbi:MAG: thioredoxin family protein [Elusimicrobia bacterium]|jgi:peroxiredoxin|nr:MAG: thioredoxin family protein [Elusimicrobiota bacterium]